MFDFKNKTSYLILSVINAFLAFAFYLTLACFSFLLLTRNNTILYSLNFSFCFGLTLSLIGLYFSLFELVTGVRDKEITLNMWRDSFLKSFKVWILPYFIFAAIWNKIVKNKERIT